jgi:hypothetical protein
MHYKNTKISIKADEPRKGQSITPLQYPRINLILYYKNKFENLKKE